MCYIDDYDEHADVWEEDVIVARKDHRCHCCGGTIRKGTAYTHHVSITRGDVTDEKQCYACSVMVERFAKEHDGMYFCPSQMPYQLVECVDEGDAASVRWKLELLNMDRRRETRKRKLAAAAIDGRGMGQ